MIIGDIFPKNFPPNKTDFFKVKYFWHKYFLSKKNYFLLAKNATYMDYEILINVFNGKNIDLSKAIILNVNKEGINYNEYKKIISQISDNKQIEISKILK